MCWFLCKTDFLYKAPWVDIIGMRKRLVHAYYDINLDILWRTVQGDLPTLIAQIEPLAPEAGMA